jgi:hypothetical protein
VWIQEPFDALPDEKLALLAMPLDRPIVAA